MKRISFSFLFPLLALALLISVLNRNVFMVPALGILLNPFKGVVQNEKSTETKMEMDFGRKASSTILFDERSVPHIFANNSSDLFFNQGYVTASNRLWQMDFLSYAAAGRLSEVFGEDLLDYDRNQRRVGLLTAAKNSLTFIETHPETKLALDNYTKGVNAYIHQLSASNFPLEYKLLDYRPEPWTNLKSVLIMKYMGAQLAGYEEDLPSSYLLAALGKKEYDKLFSNYFINETRNKFSIDLVKDTLPLNSYFDFSFLESSSQIANNSHNPKLGSNSWVIGPQKSKSGSAILCNDPHLTLSIPAIWFELQLQSPEMNVYGYSIPGTPGIIIGYNNSIAWGLTNGSVDVCNFFKLELKDKFSQYQLDGSWKDTKQTIEAIKIKNGKPFYDTIYYTIHGPIVSDFRFGAKEKEGLAMSWALHEPSNEFLALIQLNKANNYDSFKAAIQHFKCPTQNFAYADVKGNIANHLQGRIRKNPKSGMGKFILKGTNSKYLLKEVLPQELPALYNPEQGFIGSANNNPFPNNSSLSINGYYSELRYNKINQLLSKPGLFSVDDMKRMQCDNTDRLAELAVPVLISFISKDNKYEKELRKWNRSYTKESKMALVFEHWWAFIKDNTWDELAKYPKVQKQPDDLVLLDLMVNDPNNLYFDNLSTNAKETARDIVQLSFEQLTQSWLSFPLTWGDYNQVSIQHMTNIPALSCRKKSLSGHSNAINALSHNWGPALRFIVEMSDRPQGYGIYAGGQSGNPASQKYDAYIEDWTKGRYYKLHFFLNQEEGESKTIYKWIIK